ncbi:MAG: signal transduction histidine kinase [Roseivirga sp.]|jgi:signal transduction histidine kinase
MAFQDQIFIPFFTTKLGNGIGLSLLNQIIKLHGGELSLLPSEEGSRFVVRLVGKG